jgi:heme exporter protein A
MRLMISLEAKNLGKWFGGRKVFEDIRLRLEEGSVLVVSGKNGSGKTTLLKVLCGLIAPTKGEVIISFEGKKLSREEQRNLLGLVMPDLELYGELTAFENLLFLSRIGGHSGERRIIQEKIDRVGLGERQDDLVSSFSSGMKQRLKYAFALLNDPRILFLDEPKANLDQEGISLVDQVIESQKKKAIVVIATNEQSDLKYADQRIHLGG